MNEIEKINDDIKEIISITGQKLDVLLNQDLLNEINEFFTSSSSSSGGSINLDNTGSQNNSSTNNIEIFAKMSNNCKEYEFKFEKNDIDLEVTPKIILGKFIDTLKSVIENCACRLNSLIYIKYNEIIKELRIVKNEKGSTNTNDLSSSSSSSSSAPSTSTSRSRKQNSDPFEGDKNIAEITKIKSNFPSVSNKELLDALFCKESKLSFGLIFLGAISCLNEAPFAKNIQEFKKFINFEFIVDSHFIPSLLTEIFQPLSELNLEIVKKLLSEEVILEYVAIMASRLNSFDIFCKTTERFNSMNLMNVIMRLYKKEKEETIKAYYLNVLSYYSLNKSPTILIETLKIQYEDITTACILAEKILLNFSPKKTNEENVKFLVNHLYKIQEGVETKANSNQEKIILHIYNALLEFYPDCAIAELSKKLLVKIYDLGLIIFATKKDGSIIYTNNSIFRDINQRTVPTFQLNKDLSFLLRICKVKRHPNPNMIRMLEDVIQILIKIYDLVFDISNLDLATTLEEIITFVFSNSPNLISILQETIFGYVNVYKKELQFLCKFLYSCFDKVDNLNSKGQGNTTIEPSRPPIKTPIMALVSSYGSRDNKQKKLSDEENYEQYPKKMLIEIDNTNNKFSIKFNKFPFGSYIVNYFNESSVEGRLAKIQTLLKLLLKVPTQIQARTAIILFISHLEKLVKDEISNSRKRAGKLNRNTLMILKSKRNIQGMENIMELQRNIEEYKQVKNKISKEVIDAIGSHYLNQVFDGFNEIVNLFNETFQCNSDFIIKFILKFLSIMLKAEDRKPSPSLQFFLINNKKVITNHTLSQSLHVSKKARKLLQLIPLTQRTALQEKFNEEIDQNNKLLMNEILNLSHKNHYYNLFHLIEIKRILNMMSTMPNNQIKKIFYAITPAIKKNPTEPEKFVIDIILNLAVFDTNYIISLILDEFRKNSEQNVNKYSIAINLASDNSLKIIYLKGLKEILKKHKVSSEILSDIVKSLFTLIESNSEEASVKVESIKVFTYIAAKSSKYKLKEDSSIILNLIEIGSKNEGLIKAIIKSLEEIIRQSKDKEKCREELTCFLEKAKESPDRSLCFSTKCLSELMK